MATQTPNSFIYKLAIEVERTLFLQYSRMVPGSRQMRGKEEVIYNYYNSLIGAPFQRLHSI